MDKKIRKKMRFLKPFRWLRAFLGGCYWLPCPICREQFGGFESHGVGLMTSWTRGTSVCPACVETAKQRNKIFKASTPVPIEKLRTIYYMLGPKKE